jgi:hypothetical protein
MHSNATYLSEVGVDTGGEVREHSPRRDAWMRKTTSGAERAVVQVG